MTIHKRPGFSLIELALVTGLFAVLTAAMMPLWTGWQRWCQRAFDQAVIQWEGDFVSQRIFSKALECTHASVETGLLHFEFTDLSPLNMGVSNQRFYERRVSTRYLTYEPTKVANWNVQQSDALITVQAQLSRGEARQDLNLSLAAP